MHPPPVVRAHCPRQRVRDPEQGLADTEPMFEHRPRTTCTHAPDENLIFVVVLSALDDETSDGALLRLDNERREAVGPSAELRHTMIS